MVSYFCPSIYFMDSGTLGLIISIIALLLAVAAIIISSRKKENSEPVENYNVRPLQLQAYERLTVLAERIALPNLISRVSQPGLEARQMQKLLIDNIKQEFEYNISQQVYVSGEAWDAVKKLKDQNILMINQVATSLPLGASGIDLNRQVLEFLMTSNKASLHELVMQGLNEEVRSLIK